MRGSARREDGADNEKGHRPRLGSAIPEGSGVVLLWWVSYRRQLPGKPGGLDQGSTLFKALSLQATIGF